MSTEIPGVKDINDLELIDENGDSLSNEGPAHFGITDAMDPYQGAERRKTHRRDGGDRREQVRFEPDKPERRSVRDRRVGSWKTDSTV